MTTLRQLSLWDIPELLCSLGEETDRAWLGDLRVADVLLDSAGTSAGVGLVVVAPDQTLVGATVLAVDGQGAQLQLLWVSESWRRRGLARAMLAGLGDTWKNLIVSVTMPDRADADALDALLGQFAFRRIPPGPDLPGPTWRTRRVRRTTGRGSLVRVTAL
jgi:GNAT superfamily N-acetyltransferase